MILREVESQLYRKVLTMKIEAVKDEDGDIVLWNVYDCTLVDVSYLDVWQLDTEDDLLNLKKMPNYKLQ